MTDTLPKSNRWRWLLGCLLVIFGCRLWWWPQADPRLVGRWSVAANGDASGPYTTYVFRDDGILEDRVPGEKTMHLHWSTSGDELFISSRVPGPLLKLYSRLLKPRTSEVEHLYLKQIDSGRFTMGHARQYDYDIVMTRLAE